MSDTSAYAGMNRADLLALCASRSLPQYGAMADIVKRLERYDAEHPRVDGGDDAGQLVDDIDSLLGGPDTTTIDAAPDAAELAVVASNPDPGPGTADGSVTVTVTVEPEPEQESKGKLSITRAMRRGVDHDNDPSTFTHEFPSYGPPDDLSHHRMITEIADLARQAGHTVRGGGRRVGKKTVNGQRFELYAISVRPPQQG